MRRRLSYANVMSTLAVFLVLGGASAFATTQLVEGPGQASAGAGPLAGSKGAAFRRAVTRWLQDGTPVSIGIQGDSITFGFASVRNSFATVSYPALLREMVRGWLGGDFLEFISAADNDDKRWTGTGTWAAVNQGPGRTARRTVDGGTKSWGPVFASHFLIYYVEEPGGASLETRIDEGAWSAAVATAGSGGIKAKAVPAGTADFHTLSLRPGAGGKPLTIVGVSAVVTGGKPGSAHGVFRLGYPSTKVAAITRNESSLDALRTGFTLPSLGLASGKVAAGRGADLNLIAFTTNDYIQQTDLAAYKADLALAGRTAEELGGSVLYLAMPEPDRAPKAIPWSAYRDAMAEVAAAVDAGFLDLNEPLGGRGTPLYDEAMYDELHPSAIYHREMASRIFEAIWFPIEPEFSDRLREGVVRLNGGLATVKTPKVTAASRIVLTRTTASGVPGLVSERERVAGERFVIQSTEAADKSYVRWQIIEP